MIPKKFRLTRPEFINTRKNGYLLSSPYFSARVIILPDLGFAGYSVVISSKLVKHAVGRNSLRRAIYHCLRGHAFSLSGSVILYPKPSVLNLANEEICYQLDRLLSKIRSQTGAGVPI